MFRAQLRRRPFAYTQTPLRLSRLSHTSNTGPAAPLIQLKNATIYKDFLDQNNASPLFSDVNFRLPTQGEHWAILSTKSTTRTDFLQVLNGRYLCTPPDARSYPHLLQNNTPHERAIAYIGFDAERTGSGGTAVKGQYLSQRYEAHREVDDWSLLDYLEGNTELNALEKPTEYIDSHLLASVVANLDLDSLLHLPVSNLSNGQTRRARIAKALLAKPDLLLLDGPFMGLDPMTTRHISAFLQQMAEQSNPNIILSLRVGDEMPSWITHVLVFDPLANTKVRYQGSRASVSKSMHRMRGDQDFFQALRQTILPISDRPSRAKKTEKTMLSRDALPKTHAPLTPGEPVVEMQGVKVSYGADNESIKRTVLGNWSRSVDGAEEEGLWWNVRRGERWGVFGPNGSGKTTLLSLITSDHPQTYGLPIKLFGRSRIPSPGQLGISIFELQARMGHSSPEVHTYFPKHLSIRRVLESAWADTPLSKPRLTRQNDVRVEAFLRWFAPELEPTRASGLQALQKTSRGGYHDLKRSLERLQIDSSDIDWADTMTFRDLPFGSQRLLLFLRALVSEPDLIILDEALSGMDEVIREKCLLFLAHGEKLDYKPGKKSHTESLQTKNDMVNFGGIQDKQALLTISHRTEDIPGCIRQWICLPEPSEGKPARVGELPGPLELHPDCWNEIWDLSIIKAPTGRRTRKPSE
ncbi:P-loop containing nucleoside triphosphate hydrolase protein [Aureobasidium sp. EXF-10727]|nr:P-loop containing nucleoside triphosphate hydrolase protein [Aureobasidium sp. EXF-10727]